MSRTLMSTTTSYLYDGVNAAQEQSGGTVTANMLTGGVDEHFLRTDSTGTFSFLTDALGSTVGLTNSSAASVEQYSYSPYGLLSASGSNTNPYTYTGRETADGLGLDYYRARYYNPTTGRFLSEDPMGFLGSGTNLYAYAKNSPINFNDPTGLCPKCLGPAFQGLLIAAFIGILAALLIGDVMGFLLWAELIFSASFMWAVLASESLPE